MKSDNELAALLNEPQMNYEILLRAGATAQQAHRLLDQQSDETRKLHEMRRKQSEVGQTL
jgi:hypothetical protein